MKKSTGAERERFAADVLWDELARLGLVDSRGGAEYERAFGEPGRVEQFASAAFSIVGRLWIGESASSSSAERAQPEQESQQ